MTRRVRQILTTCVFLSVATPARAQGNDVTGAPAVSPNDPALTPSPPKPPKFPQFFLFGNGLALLISRLSFGLELLPITHHSVGLNLYGQYGGVIGQILKSTNIEPNEKGVFIGGGGEFGYRFYAHRDGPFGPFVGGSFIGNFYHVQDSFTEFGPVSHSLNYVQYGPAMDVGWSFHLDKTTVIALSLGAQYTFITIDSNLLTDLTALLVGDGLRPRGGIQVGKVF